MPYSILSPRISDWNMKPYDTATRLPVYSHHYMKPLQALDILTPLGRGQAQLLTGPPGCGKSACALDAVLGQAGTGVRCIMAVLGRTPAEMEALNAKLLKEGALEYTTVISAPAGGWYILCDSRIWREDRAYLWCD